MSYPIISTTAKWQPYREPLRSVVLRNGTIAIILGAVFTRLSGGWERWPLATLLMLWPSFGGHCVEVWFLNWLRPRISIARGAQAAARIVLWFVAGAGFAFAMRLTVMALTKLRPPRSPSWWLAGLVFIGIELLAHLALRLRGRPSFYNGLG